MTMREHIEKLAIEAGFPPSTSVAESNRRIELFATAYQHALADLAHEFDSHDYFREARMAEGFAKTSTIKVGMTK